MGACMSKKGQQQIQEKIQPSISTPTNQPTSPPIPPPPASQTKEKIPQKPSQHKEAAAANTAATAIAVKKPIHISTPKKPQEGADEDPIDAAKPAIREESCNVIAAAAAAVRTSSCTKEEVDAILIQCGRLSRSSSGKGANENSSRAGTSKKYSGSKRSYDFDNDGAEKMCGDDEMPQIRLAHRRTPSRERDSGASELKRSGSRDEGKRSGSRRASRSPGRRQETPTERTRPGKMVSVPATVTTAARKGSTKRNGEGSIRSSASPRARSPAANTRASNENPHHQNSQSSLSRNPSRKAEQSPYRRNPMSELDGNIIRTEQAALMKNHDLNNKASNCKVVKNKESGDGEKGYNISLQKSNENAVQVQQYDDRNIGAVEISNGANHSNSSAIREQLMNCRTKEQLEPEIGEETADAKAPSKSIEATAATGAMAEVLVPKTITRSRSSRRSRDLDIGIDLNPDTLNPPTYASLLLEDIKNYHNQSAAISLPPCVSKAQSILEAVADLNSCTSSNLSSGFSEYKSSEADRSDNYNNGSFEGRFSRKRLATKDPFLESEIVVNNNDLIEPSLHKYVTVRNGRVDMEPQESAGSNSFLGHHWASSWEPNSAESTDRWASQSNGGEEVEQALNETDHDFEVGGRRLRKSGGSNNSLLPAATTSSGKKRDYYLSQQGGVGSGKIGVRYSSLPVAAAAAQ